MSMQKTKVKNHRCPKFNSTQTYFRFYFNNFRCRNCGNTFTITEKNTSQNIGQKEIREEV